MTDRRRIPKPLKIVVPFLLIGAIGIGVISRLRQQPPETGLQLSGRIEG